MEEEPSAGAAQTQPDILRQTPVTESQDTISNTGLQARSDLQQVAEEASKAAEQPGGFKIYEEENEPQDPPKHFPPCTPEDDLELSPEEYAMIATSLAARTTSLAAIARDTPIEGDPGHGIIPFPYLEAGQQILGDNALSWGDVNMDGGSFGGSQQNEASSVLETEQHQIQAFAKLEFDDGEFYMNTYAVEIGRDIYAARRAADLQARQDTDTKSGKRSTSSGGSVTSSKVKHRNGQNTTSSVASDSGGVIAVDHYESEPTAQHRSRKPKSWSPSSQQVSRKSSMLLSNGKTDYNALAMASINGHNSGTNDFGPNAPMPAPDLVPLVPIRPPALLDGTPSSGKSISRKHIKIAYNFEKNLFEIQILGRNGGFVDDEWYAQGDVQTLTNGSIIQIGGVGIRFVLPDVAPGETGAETGFGSDPLSGGKLSFDMAETVENEDDEDVEEDEERCRTLNIKKEDGEEEEEEEEDEEEEDGDEEETEEPEVVKIRAKGKKKPGPEPLPVTKRKGPGRPPKNGIISKREQALLARQAREKAKVVADRDPGTPHDHGKLKAGKDTKSVKKEQPSVQANGKRKYTKRKRAGGTDDQRPIRESTEQTDSVPPEQSIAAKLPPSKPAKEKKPPKPPRSPSPVFDEATLTPEQLAKPSQNYVVLIHEALSNSETGAMSLPQIYRAMQRRYPYFKLRATTVGWQSSVRHNLSQNAAFRKIQRDGKGWMWGLVPGVSIEKEKKPKPTPPPAPQQPYYPPGPPTMQYPFSYPARPLPNGPVPPNPYVMSPNMPPAHMPHGQPPRGPHGFPPFVSAQSESTYQSPYQSTPPPRQSSAPAPPPQHTNSANGHYPAPTSQLPAQASNHNQQPLRPASSPSPAPNQPKTEVLAESKPTPTKKDFASPLTAEASKATEIIVKSALTNGDAYERNSAVEKEAADDKGSGKRPLENGDSDGATNHGQPETKRVAIEA